MVDMNINVMVILHNLLVAGTTQEAITRFFYGQCCSMFDEMRRDYQRDLEIC